MRIRVSASAILLSGIGLLGSCGSSSEQVVEPDGGEAGVGVETGVETKLRAAFVELAEEESIPGVAYAVVDSEGIVEAGGIGFADVANEVPVTADTLFHIGSAHKAINVLLVATLVDDETIEWDTAIVEIVPDYAFDESLTVRHLLTMTGGIPADAEDDLPVGAVDQAALADVVFESVESADTLAEPGAVFDYSNISASVAGYAAVLADQPESANVHQDYLELVEDRVLGPLGMDDSFLLASEAIASGLLSRTYELEGGVAVLLESEDTDDDLLAPSGALKSSANDMARFLQVLLADGVAPDGSSVVSSASIETMWEPALEGYAMGWEVGSVDDVPYLAHEGSFDGFLSLIMVAPDLDLGLVVLTNADTAATDLLSAAPRLLIESAD